MRTVNRFLVAVATVTSISACEGRPPEYGVAVFSTDTTPVVFTMTLTGSLALSMRAAGVRAQPDKSLHLVTPAQLAWHRGDGTARIVSVSGTRMAVQPMGFSPDSADTTTVEGAVVILTKPPERRIVTLKAEEPAPATKAPEKKKD